MNVLILVVDALLELNNVNHVPTCGPLEGLHHK